MMEGNSSTEANNPNAEEDSNKSHNNNVLSLVEKYDWNGALARIQECPQECQAVGDRGRTPLHVACDHDAPAEVIRSLIQQYPKACLHVGTTGMNPLHIACSSDHASEEVVRVLLVESAKVDLNLATQMASMKDVDHDTPLHSACRCGASLGVLRLLMLVYPDAVHQRDYEGLTPLLRLWVREYVLLGDDVINGVQGPESLTGELGEAWKKTMLLLYCAYIGSLKPLEGGASEATSTSTTATATPNNKMFRPMHAFAAIDCPRRVVKIATKVYRDQLLVKDEHGMTPLLIASQAPIYKFQDISYDGTDLEEMLEEHLYATDEDTSMKADEEEDDDSCRTIVIPSVIDILVEADPAAAKIADPSGKRPLHHAIDSGKTASQGVRALTEVEHHQQGLEHDLEHSLKITTTADMG
jgi:ankyrin repeat protein